MENKIFLFDVLNSTLNILKEKRPSNLLPFKGNFPLVNPGQERLFNIGCEGKTYLEECDDWIQKVLIKAQKIADIEKIFLKFLNENNLKEKYYKMNGKEKVEVIKNFFDSSIVSADDLIIDDGNYGKL